MSEKIRVLLYYKYVSIENAEEYAAKHLEFCKSIGLKGRILIADEGINGTVSGDYETTQKYMDWVHSDERFADLWFKIDEENQQAFRKMFVRYKKEIVHLGLEDNNFDSDINPLETTGEYLNPKQFKEALLDEDTVVLDTRNDYEYDLGHFRGAIRPDIRNFRELPQWVRDNKDKFMEKRVVVRNSRVGWFEKVLKMLDNYTVVLQHMEKIRKFKVNFGMVRCMFLMIVSRCQLIMLIQLLLVKIILMEHLVNVMSIVQIRFVTNKFLLQKKTKRSMFEGARLNVVHMNVIAMCKKMVYHVKNGQNV